ncbi:hypothetical protein FNH71_18615 [Salmonella enterica subsp. diarizonae]|nr:hypothetical protein [Salmonella enterica subsp. diarizonae]
MFNVKRNGASVEITDIPQSIPFSVFKNIADETGAVEILTCYFKDKTEYEVIIQHTNENMAGTVAWMALEAREPEFADSNKEQKFKFKDLPHEIQLEAARTLRERIVTSQDSVHEFIGCNIGRTFIALYQSEGGEFYKPVVQ